MLAVVAGALKAYLEDKGEGVDQAVPVAAPVNVRPESEFETAGNRISLFIAQLPLQMNDPVDRLKEVVRTTSSAKELSDAIGAKELADINKFTPPVTLALVSQLASSLGSYTKEQAKKMAATVVSNVPGPQQPLYLLGARLVNFSGIGPLLNGLGLFHAVASYDGKIGISLTSCRDMMPDPGFYAECLRNSFDTLFEAAANVVNVKKPPERTPANAPAKEALSGVTNANGIGNPRASTAAKLAAGFAAKTKNSKELGRPGVG